METTATPDWRRCATDLAWSWHNATDTHRRALDLQKENREVAGFDLLLQIQRENPAVQQDYRACRAADRGRFWEMAWTASKLP
jgi:hypothetical protein